MTGLNSMVLLVVVMMVASLRLQGTLAQTRHVVGDTLGWTIPIGGAATYTTWASQQTFTVGDTLLFNFTTGLHNVVEVSHVVYGQCSSVNTLSPNSIGPVVVKLTQPGNHYYICTVVSHCQIGQKLAINVSPATSTTPQGAPSSAPVSPPSTIAFPPYFPYYYVPVGSPIPPPITSAAPSFTAIILVTFLAVVLASLY
ncbi:mavicyanin-like [Cynara cardunculus var. scolymus]|uniref:Cupredoxin n=1 Tax=Cynara cardunculus var. scolymus TaxID=59895 RepID=A0A103Y2I0_CYNCS|nr:mavicyanin-like [Cynara cardunculus var. scolymus]KVI01334.1 Cupredoxin [Cynara cardunculus var. scolymus]